MAESTKTPWHISKQISIGHIISTATVAIMGITYVAGIESRMSVIEQRLDHQAEADQRLNDRIETSHDELRTDLRDINAKLDRLIERQND